MRPDDPPLLRHMERHLGAYCEATRAGGQRGSILAFADQPVQGALTVSSFGLSRHRLPQPRGPELRQELIVSAEQVEWKALASVVDVAAEQVLSRHSALLRGELLGPTGRLVPGSSACAFFCCHPGCFPQSFEDLKVDGDPILFVWLVAVLPDEATYIETHGAGAFMSLIKEHSPNLLDWRRSSLPVCPSR